MNSNKSLSRNDERKNVEKNKNKKCPIFLASGPFAYGGHVLSLLAFAEIGRRHKKTRERQN